MAELNSHDFESVYKDLNVNIDKLGCVMLDLEPLKDMESPDEVVKDDLYFAKNKTRKWIDGWVVGKVPHITLLYGLMENAHKWKKHVDAVLKGWKLNEVEIDHIGFFETPYEDEPYYCIVAHIKLDKKLVEGNQRLQFLPHVNTYPDFKAHMTICYIKKSDSLRNELIKHFNNKWAGKKMKVKAGVNYGYKPGEE